MYAFYVLVNMLFVRYFYCFYDPFQGTSSASFISLPEDILYFDAVYSCGGELSVLLIDYNTWGDPILEQIPGCPALLFQGEAFSLAEEDWVCI